MTKLQKKITKITLGVVLLIITFGVVLPALFSAKSTLAVLLGLLGVAFTILIILFKLIKLLDK